MRSIGDQKIARIVFAAVINNIIEYIKKRKRRIISRLLFLGLFSNEDNQQLKGRSRIYSADSSLQINEEINIDCNFDDYHDQVPKYMDFLNCLCDCYEEVLDVTSGGIELACQEILVQCQIGNNLHGYNIHKSMFYEYVLKNTQIQVKFWR